ncbi:arsenate reductase family protein [Pseudomonas sp. MAP12]|uniref:Arsenate reductase family protein n=1 Tax=Geopseudomonas aromaticivorans TaxID=2849492 RepID=A0ABS6MWE7_9GAMM|nr:ArsC/Spx/MgsR family protein [Pseudomonas aromaticivorans]MBV2133130.1 arsenate reductase family protein [Pseudomonas aromaticivorans]
MTSMVFYEKPGCASNRRQKQQLRAAGFALQVRDLLSEPWTREQLRPFFAERPVAEWFNRAAPAIKSGAIDPQALDAEQALALLLAQPLLIRRPLISCGHLRMAGFDPLALNALLPEDRLAQLAASPEGCAHGDHGHGRCAAPGSSR